VRTLKRADDLVQLDAGKETLAQFAAEWWEQYAVGNLARKTSRGTRPPGTVTCSRGSAATDCAI
jgi:hypothetical protein